MKIKTAAQVVREEEFMERAKMAVRKLPRSSDRSDYESSQKQLHDKALEIRQYINETYPAYCDEHPVLKTFRASYGWSSDPETQEIRLVIELARAKDDYRLVMMLLMAQEFNSEMLYEAKALGIDDPEPFYGCWEDELGPYIPTTPNSAS